MSDKTIEQRVKKIIVDQLNVNEEQVTSEASFGRFRCGLFGYCRTHNAFEEEFSEEIDGEILNLMQKKCKLSELSLHISEKAEDSTFKFTIKPLKCGLIFLQRHYE